MIPLALDKHNLSHYAVHAPLKAKKELEAKYREKLRNYKEETGGQWWHLGPLVVLSS